MKTMKTKWAKAGTMFLAAAAVLSSCSNERIILVSYTDTSLDTPPRC